MYVSDYKQRCVINIFRLKVYREQRTVELEDGSKETYFCIFAGRSLCLYKDCKEANTMREFNEFIKALQGSRRFFQFGKATNWDKRKEKECLFDI